LGYEHKKTCNVSETVKERPRLLWQTNRKSRRNRIGIYSASRGSPCDSTAFLNINMSTCILAVRGFDKQR